ncbi:hypothetical protein [Ancylobacter defluvii]|uniref:hypothetical protein n=1 Tax=Ancylobacter defluvii TaxID=1282440 RepID=UPI002852BED2|nr:hypothetical protein [Ancylobacter defluvii]
MPGAILDHAPVQQFEEEALMPAGIARGQVDPVARGGQPFCGTDQCSPGHFREQVDMERAKLAAPAGQPVFELDMMVERDAFEEVAVAGGDQSQQGGEIQLVEAGTGRIEEMRGVDFTAVEIQPDAIRRRPHAGP